MTEPSRPNRPTTWQGNASRIAASQQAKTGKRNKIVALGFAILLLLGATAAWVFWPTAAPQPYTLPVWVSDTTDRHIPINPWAAQDRKAWLDLALKHNNAFTSQQQNLLVRELGRLESLEDHKQPVIVYLSGYTLTDPDGKVFLLPSDANLEKPETWLGIDAVVKNLRGCKAKHKLLILDVFDPFTYPAAGILADDTAARLEEDLKKATQEDPDLQVLTSCSPGQVSHASEDLGHSVFAYFLLKGLSGEADGANSDGRKDARVELLELVEYITGNVDRWAWSNRQRRQTPALYGSRTDFALVGVDPGKTVTPAPLDTTYPQWLTDRWALRDAWWADGSYRAAPGAFRALESALLHAEQQWRGGMDREAIEKDFADLLGGSGLKDQRDRALREQRRFKANRWTERDSLLSEAAARGIDLSERRPSDDTVYELKQLTEVYSRTQQPKPDDKDKAKYDADSTAFLKKYDGKPTDLAWTLFAILRDEINPPASEVRLFAELLRKDPKVYDEKLKDYREVRLIQRLAALKPANPGDWPAVAVHNALKAAAAAEVVWAFDAPSLLWVETPLEQAGKEQKKGEDLLFSAEPASWDKAAKSLGDTAKAYEDILARLVIVHGTQVSRDQALVLLPAFVPYLIEGSEGRELAKTWEDAVKTSIALQYLLTLPEDPSSALSDKLGEMENRRDEWQAVRKKLEAPLAPARRKGIMDQSKRPAPADWWEMDALLELPWLPAKDRAELGTAWRALGGRLQAEKADGALPSLDPATAQRQERDRGLLRARTSITLLRLTYAATPLKGKAGSVGGADDGKEAKARAESLKNLEKALSDAEANPGVASWGTLERQLRTAWAPFRSTRSAGL